MSTASSPPSPVRDWGLLDVVVMLGGWLTLAVVAAAVYAGIAPAHPSTASHAALDAGAWAAILLLVLPWLALVGVPLWATRLFGAGPREDLGLTLSWRSAGIGVLGGLLGLAGAELAASATTAVLGHGLSSSVGTLFTGVQHASALPLVLLAVLAGLGAPVAEELAFRGLLQGALLRRGLSPTVAVVLTAAAFAAYHLEPDRFVILLVIGLALGTVRRVTGSTPASMVAHVTNNAPSMVVLIHQALTHH